MGLFDRYLAGQLLIYFGFFSLVLVAVYWVNRAIGLFDRLIAGGSNLSTFLEFSILALPNVIYAVLPVSALVATLYGVNRLTADSEMVVAQTTGLSPWQLARPVAVFGLLVGLMMSVLVHALVPLSRTALAERSEDVARDITTRFLLEGEFLHPADGVTVYVREITETGELLGLFLQDGRSEDVVTTYTAERALLVREPGGTGLVMFRGMAQTMKMPERSLITTSFQDFAYDLAALTGEDDARLRDPRELPTATLLRADAVAQAVTGDDRAKILFEGHARFSEPMFAAAVPLLALGFLMLGGYSRMGLWRQILAAAMAAVTLEMLANVAEDTARGDAGLWWTTYLPPLATLGLGLGLIWREARRPPRLGAVPA
ncbi:MAG: LPS export ABC transporter permease LptF [Pseudomonadota bacterium]